jgi:outer membrane protein assembly factor BamA
MSARQFAIVLLALGACSQKPPRKPGDDWLKAIEFEGNSAIKDKTLATGLALKRTQKRGGSPDPYLVQVDADRVRGEYLRKGYLHVDVRARVERVGDGSTVIYKIEEGDRARTKVVINGIASDPGLPISKIRETLPLEDGQLFDYEVYDMAKEPLMAVVKDAGYAHARLDATVYADRANHTAIVQLDYTLGPKCQFGDVEITGVDGRLAEAVRGRLQFEPGQTYSTSAVTATQRALYGLNRFSTVQVQPVDDGGANPTVRMKVAVTEAARREIKLGGGLGMDPTAYEVRGRAGYSIAGFPTDMDTVTLDFRPAYAYLRDGSGYQPRIRALARLERQDILWTYSKGDVEVGYNYLAVEAYTSYGPRTGLGFSTPLGTEKVQLRVGWGLERLDFRDISPLIDEALQMQLGLDDSQLIGRYEQSISLDLRDHPITPRLGVYAEVRASEGTPYAGGAFEYVQLVPDLRGYVPIGPVVLAGHVRTGGIFGDVPATERFFSGGGSHHRGFGERKLSPFVMGEVDGETRYVPYGGAGMLETGLEARIPITTWREIGIGTVVFLDGGDVTEGVSDLDPMSLHWAIGTGLRLHTLVGPIRADLGYRLNRLEDAAPGSRFAFHLSLGEAF